MSHDRLIMGIPIPGKDGLYIETAPWPHPKPCGGLFHAYWHKYSYFRPQILCSQGMNVHWNYFILISVFIFIKSKYFTWLTLIISGVWSGIRSVSYGNVCFRRHDVFFPTSSSPVDWGAHWFSKSLYTVSRPVSVERVRSWNRLNQSYSHPILPHRIASIQPKLLNAQQFG